MTVASGPAKALRIAGETNVGKLRTTNEDALIVEPRLGLYAVLDGMGGANAGDIASQLARDVIRDFVGQRRGALPPRVLLEAAIQTASAAIHNAAIENRERHGMGTTVVACIATGPLSLVVAHVGDSRAYLLRGGRLQALTRDHTIVEELVDRGLLSPDEVEQHPYKNVLSKNLGARPETQISVLELELQPGDRVLLCSDGLYGYASTEAIQYILGSGDAPEHVAHELVELALRGGGGDNVSTIVLEAPQPPPTATQVVRTSGAIAWWQKRQRFLVIAKDRGLTRNPIVRGLPPKDALDVVALSLCQAVFHDLEKSTGVNVWTFAQNIATAWFERGGDWKALRGLIDILNTAARVCVDEVKLADAQLGFLLDVAVSRALVVAELALGNVLSDRLRRADADLIALHNAQHEPVEGTLTDIPVQAPASFDKVRATTLAGSAVSETRTRAPSVRSDEGGPRGGLVERPTLPFMRPDRPVTNAGVSAELLAAIGKVTVLARGASTGDPVIVAVLLAVEGIATEGGANFAAAVAAARELYGTTPLDEHHLAPLFQAFETARALTAASTRRLQAPDAMRARVLTALTTAHQRLVSATTGLVLEAALPLRDKLRELQAVTSKLRDDVARAEQRRAGLERKHATDYDPSLPWGSRGTTEW